MAKNNSLLAELVGRQVSIGISEPWDFGEEVSTSNFSGTIIDVYVSTHIRQHSERTVEY